MLAVHVAAITVMAAIVRVEVVWVSLALMLKWIVLVSVVFSMSSLTINVRLCGPVLRLVIVVLPVMVVLFWLSML